MSDCDWAVSIPIYTTIIYTIRTTAKSFYKKELYIIELTVVGVKCIRIIK